MCKRLEIKEKERVGELYLCAEALAFVFGAGIRSLQRTE
jgi:hypothetical protein